MEPEAPAAAAPAVPSVAPVASTTASDVAGEPPISKSAESPAAVPASEAEAICGGPSHCHSMRTFCEADTAQEDPPSYETGVPQSPAVSSHSASV